MIKKLSASLFALALVVGVFAPVQAQETICVYGDLNGGAGLERAIVVPIGGLSFDIVVQSETSVSAKAAEFRVDEIRTRYPGVLSSGVEKYNDALDLGDNSIGEYLLSLKGCFGPGPLDLVRITYFDFTGAIGADEVLGITGLVVGGDPPSSFGGEPGYVDCNNVKVTLTKKPWDLPGYDPTKVVESADGVCVLNADVIPNATTSMGVVKSRF